MLDQTTSHNNPLLSVIMSVYNGERYLARAIESVLNQNFVDFEFIVVDDCSTDGSGSICADFAAVDPRLRIIRNSQNLGLAKSLNRALQISKGCYIARMDADDVSLPGRFEAQFQYLETHPQVGLLGTFYQEIDESGNVQGKIVRFPTEPIIIRWRLSYENPIPHPPIMMRKELVIQAGGYDEKWRTAQDYDLFTRLSAKTKLSNYPEVLLYWRVHRNSISSTRNEEQRANALAISQRYVSDLLGVQTPEEIVRLLWYRTHEDTDKSIQRSHILYELSRSILSEPRWSLAERNHLRRYAFRKIFYHLRPHITKAKTWRLMAQLVMLSPPAFMSMLATKIVDNPKRRTFHA